MKTEWVSIKAAKYAGKVDLIENEEYGYCSLNKAKICLYFVKNTMEARQYEAQNKTGNKVLDTKDNGFKLKILMLMPKQARNLTS